jgi:hypothetical protein
MNATVHVVKWELQESSNGEVCGLVGVYSTRSSALLAAYVEAEDWIKLDEPDHKPQVFVDGALYVAEGDAPVGDRNFRTEWDVWIEIEEMEVKP